MAQTQFNPPYPYYVHTSEKLSWSLATCKSSVYLHAPALVKQGTSQNDKCLIWNIYSTMQSTLNGRQF